MKIIYIIIGFVLVGAVLSNKLVHDKRVEHCKTQLHQEYKDNILIFQKEYDSIATMLYDEDARIAIQFELLYDPSYFFQLRDTLVKTVLFDDFFQYNVYKNTFFDHFRQLAIIDVDNERIIFNIKEGIHAVSDDFDAIGNEWRFKMLNDELYRFYDEEDFEISGIKKDSNKETFKRTKIIKKPNCTSEYRAFLTYYKSTVEQQNIENLDNVYDWVYVMDWARENLFRFQVKQLDDINERYIPIDSTSIMHNFNSDILGGISFKTQKWKIPNIILREKIEEFY